MALYTRKQLSELLNLDWRNKSHRDKIGMWVKRGSLIEKNGLIDDASHQNVYWINKQLKNIVCLLKLPDVYKLLKEENMPLYNKGAEKSISKIMINQCNKNIPFLAIPVDLALFYFGEHLRRAYEYSFQKELKALQSSGKNISPTDLRDLIKLYSNRFKKEIKECRIDLESKVQQIIEENTK
jgi:hypothetical protein